MAPVIRKLRLALIGILVIGNTGCSFVISFNIKNLSKLIITVDYHLKGFGPGFEPRLVGKNIGEDDSKYAPIPPDRLAADVESRTVEFKMLPNEEIQLFSVHDELNNNYGKEFNIESMSISSPEGTISFAGQEVLKSFRPIKESWYAFGPEITGFVLEFR